eukprot:COSAG06_NODE_9854_length_1803_cov_42.650822_4_plen_42_part_01
MASVIEKHALASERAAMRAHDMCRWPRGVLGVRLLLLLMPMA